MDLVSLLEGKTDLQREKQFLSVSLCIHLQETAGLVMLWHQKYKMSSSTSSVQACTYIGLWGQIVTVLSYKMYHCSVIEHMPNIQKVRGSISAISSWSWSVGLVI